MRKNSARPQARVAEAFTLLAAIASISFAAAAAEITFIDGRVWTDVRVLSREPTSLIVLHGKAVETVHAGQLTPECQSAFQVRPPTAVEVAARKDAEQRTRSAPAAMPVRVNAPPSNATSEASGGIAEREPSDRSADELRTVRETSTVVPVDPWGLVTEIWIDGRLLARSGKAAIAQGDGPPASQSRHGRIGWIEGPIYLLADSRLAMTYRDFPIRGRLVPAGEHRYRDSSGVVHVLDAYRLY